jgi:dihydrofolate reductase
MYPKFSLDGSGPGWQSADKIDTLKAMCIHQLSAVVAVARNGTIGRANTLPWKLRSDLQRFKQLTMGHTLVMGRKTYESIGRPLPGRQTIVLSRRQETHFDGVCVVPSIEAAMAIVPGDSLAFVVGGAEIYRLAMPMIKDLYVTLVLADIQGDAYLDPWDESEFQCVESAFVPADAFNEWPSEFRHLVRQS